MKTGFAVRVYRAVVRLYPSAFRHRYGAEIEDIFGESWAGASMAPWTARARLAVGTVLDVSVSLLATHWDAVLRRARHHRRVVGFSPAFVGAEVMLVAVPLWTVLRIFHQGIGVTPTNALLGLAFAASHAALVSASTTLALVYGRFGRSAFRRRARTLRSIAIRSLGTLTALVAGIAVSSTSASLHRTLSLGASQALSWAILATLLTALPLVLAASEPALRRQGRHALPALH